MKQSTLLFNCTKNMLKVPVKGIVQSILKINPSSSTVEKFHGVQLHSLTSNWMEILPISQTNKFVFIRALGAARRLEVESKLGFLAIFNLD